MKRSVRVENEAKIATLTFEDGTVIDRFVIRVTSSGQYEVHDNMSGTMMYSRAGPKMAAADVAIINKYVTEEQTHEE